MAEYEVITEEELMKLNKDGIVTFYFRSQVIANSINELNATVKNLTERLEKTESELSVSKAANLHLV